MSASLPIALLGIVAAIWAAAVVVNWRLLVLFLSRAGDEPDVPLVLRTPERHPEKLMYFLRRSTIPRLKADADLWRLRTLLTILLGLGVVAPIAAFLLLCFVALLHK